MPIDAFYLLLTFLFVSAVAGVIAWLLVSPKANFGWVLPVLAAFVVLYLLGHQLRWGVGPVVHMFGFRVTLLFDAALAVLTALVVAGLERLVLRRA